jgi:hypothetical protein
MFHFTPPLTPEQHDAVTASKHVIYDGFRKASRGPERRSLVAGLRPVGREVFRLRGDEGHAGTDDGADGDKKASARDVASK